MYVNQARAAALRTWLEAEYLIAEDEITETEYQRRYKGACKVLGPERVEALAAITTGEKWSPDDFNRNATDYTVLRKLLHQLT